MIEFLYNDKIYYATKLDKKLKRLKITENDITILREYDNVKPQENIEYPDWYYCHFFDPITKCCYVTVSKDKTKPDKSVIKNIINDDIIYNRIILLDGKPKYPITLDKNNLPILEITYIWK